MSTILDPLVAHFVIFIDPFGFMVEKELPIYGIVFINKLDG